MMTPCLYNKNNMHCFHGEVTEWGRGDLDLIHKGHIFKVAAGSHRFLARYKFLGSLEMNMRTLVTSQNHYFWTF